MSSDNIDNADLSEDLSLLNIGCSNNESNNNEENEATSTDTDNKNTVAILLLCANCGKEGGDSMNTCNKCYLVKYCNAACKTKHKSKHKKECEKRAAELYDEKMFNKEPGGKNVQ